MATPFNLSRILNLLRSPAILFYTLPYFMALVIVGTAAQKYIGLFPATHKFFNTFVLWIGPIPLPAGTTVLVVLFINLLAHFISNSQWNRYALGTTLAHVGVLVLLLGGCMTMLHKTEGFVILRYGQDANRVYDYNMRELIVYKNDRAVANVSGRAIQAGHTVQNDKIPFTITVDRVLSNATLDNANQLIPLPAKDNDEVNQMGVALTVKANNKTFGHDVTEFSGKAEILVENNVHYNVSLQRQSQTLPFDVSLTRFDEQVYQGTDLARSYQSDVTIKDDHHEWPARVAMNKPLRYKGYTFYQSSVLNLPSGETASVLNVVKNDGWLFPYIASFLLFAGLIWHAIVRWRFKVALIICLALLSTAPAYALDNSAFARIPIMHEGRVKPLSSFADTIQHRINPNSNDNPLDWLARVFFDPIGASMEPVFDVKNAQIRHALNLQDRSPTLYSFHELNTAFITHSDLVIALQNATDLSDEQKSFLDLYAQIVFFEQAKNTFTALLPLKENGKTYFERKPDLKELEKIGQSNHAVTIIPLDGRWQSPWDVINSDQTEPVLYLWRNAAKAYIDQDNATWLSAMQDIQKQSVQNRSLAFRLNVETLYHKINPFWISMLCYGVALAFAIFAKRFVLVLAITVFGFAFHGAGLLSRMIVLQRPPVSNLYESFGFVGLVTVLIGLILSWRHKNTVIVLITALIGVALHLIGFGLDMDDSFRPLQAVLNSNFWLATHVLTITTGYACCLLTGMFAHVWLLGNSFLSFDAATKNTMQRRIHVASVWSLFFIATGTLLGGVWADQSWGRFWGWDPKENGALLIALWLIWLLHARFSRHISEFGFILGISGLILLTVLSWLGVNMLGIGLHSYGFVDGVTYGLVAFVIVDLIFLALCWFKHGRQIV